MRGYNTNRIVTPWDKRRLKLLFTMAGQRNAKMSRLRIAEHLTNEYPSVMPGGTNSWMDFMAAVLDRPAETSVHSAKYLELLFGVVIGETLGSDGPSK